tara:strand:- start:17 stop:226 length:210 start_codon:yes stop_codon:yes gene_type:complete
LPGDGGGGEGADGGGDGENGRHCWVIGTGHVHGSEIINTYSASIGAVVPRVFYLTSTTVLDMPSQRDRQ